MGSIIFYGYTLIGAIIGLIGQIIIMVAIHKYGEDAFTDSMLSMDIWLLILLNMFDIFTWPERLLSIGYYLIFKDLLPWRKKLFEIWEENR